MPRSTVAIARIVPWIAVPTALVALAGCAKKRGEEARDRAPVASSSADLRAAQQGPKGGVSPDKTCRYESATATSQLVIAEVASLDLPLGLVKDALVCSGGPLQECAGTLAQKHDPVNGEASFLLTADNRGFVTIAKVEKNAGLPQDVIDCATTILKKVDFPDSNRPASDVRLTLKYSPQQGEPTRFAGIHVTAAPPQITAGNVDANRTMLLAAGKVRGCYVLGLEGDAKLAGTVTYKLTIGADGKVGDASEEQSGNLTKAVLQCVDVVLRSLVFPKPEGGSAAITGTMTLAREVKP